MQQRETTSSGCSATNAGSSARLVRSLLEPGARLTELGFEFWPHVVEHTVRRAALVTGLPVVVTENGLATEDDAERIEYLGQALLSAARLASPMASTSVAISSGACWTASSGPGDSTGCSGCTWWTVRPSNELRNRARRGSERWRGQCPRTSWLTSHPRRRRAQARRTNRLSPSPGARTTHLAGSGLPARRQGGATSRRTQRRSPLGSSTDSAMARAWCARRPLPKAQWSARPPVAHPDAAPARPP